MKLSNLQLITLFSLFSFLVWYLLTGILSYFSEALASNSLIGGSCMLLYAIGSVYLYLSDTTNKKKRTLKKLRKNRRYVLDHK